jgi:hypothetical protein
MAGEKGNLNTSKTSTFIKGLHKDSDPAFIQEGMWTYARNAVNNTIEGDVGAISNEASNALCATAGATIPNAFSFRYIIGAIHMFSDKWIVFTASHASAVEILPRVSEIGLFEEASCTYRPIVQDACLGFSKAHLISGAAREKEDCSWQVYWADGKNPDRYLNVGDPKTWPSSDYVWLGGGPGSTTVNFYSNGNGTNILWPGVEWNQICTDSSNTSQTEPGVWPIGHPVDGCITCISINTLNCEKIRLARLMNTPCLNLRLGEGSGSLENGSYYAVIAYTIKGEKVSDYFAASNVQPVYTLNSVQGSLQLEVEADTENFDEFQLVLVANINENTVARVIGYYSTNTRNIFIDQYKPSFESIDITLIPLMTPVFEKSDQIAQLNTYLLRVGPTSKFDFNYQPLANLIETEWVSVEYPSNYYFRGGSKTNFMRDEVYTFFIRWVYNTGDKSASYHIPGRAAESWGPNGILENEPYSNSDSFPGDTRLFQTINTATVFPSNPAVYPYTLPDGGRVIGAGKMGYWESTEKYPDNRPDIWNASEYFWTGTWDPTTGQPIPSDSYDLCGLPIRHHKFPENVIYNEATGQLTGSNIAHHFRRSVATNALFIRMMSVQFKNIIYPKDNDGNDIPGIVGYEILRGSRDGNRSIIAKGMINNFRTYNRVGVPANNRTGLYANYPYNTIIPIGNNNNIADNNFLYNDPFIKSVDINNNFLDQTVPKNIISFHSPDTSFRNPYLAPIELKLYGHLEGEALQRFIEPQGHPKFKLLTNDAIWIILLSGLGDALLRRSGKKQINYPLSSFNSQFGLNWLLAGGGNGGPSAATPLPFGGINLTQSPGATTLTPSPGPNNFWYNWQIGTLGSRNSFFNYVNSGGSLGDYFAGTDGQSVFARNNNLAGGRLGGVTNAASYTVEQSGASLLPSWTDALFNTLSGVQQSGFYFMEGAQAAQELIYAFTPFRQYALQLIGHGLYDKFNPFNINDTKRFKIADSSYIFKNISFEIDDYNDTITNDPFQKYTINNYKRGQLLMLRTERANTPVTDGPKLLVTGTSGLDISLGSLGMFDDELGPTGPKINEKKKSIEFGTRIGSHYGAMKIDNDDQYGQLNTITQFPITPCEQKFNYTALPSTITPISVIDKVLVQKRINETPVIFGGDTYITRFTEKNPMFFFYNWLYTEPNGYEYNYFNSQMIPEPRYWANSERYDVSQINITSIGAWSALFNNSTTGTGFLPNDYFNLDNQYYIRETDKPFGIGGGYPGFTNAKNSYFYLSASGVRDFFVESDVINDFREVGTFDYEKCYNPYRYTDLETMFRMDKLTATEGNFYLYDYSLSITRLTNRYTSFGFLQSVYYNPEVAELCYTYYPNTITYSLPVSQTSSTDGWFIFLPLNRKDFVSQISGVKNFAKTGAFVTFKNDSPIVFQGVDTLEMDGSGTKVIIGDGGVFARDPQNIVVADRPYMYGSSQGRLSVISTPAGLYYISQDQGKVFSYGEGLQEVSQAGMKWWFDYFLPCKLVEDFPDYPYTDNPVAGVGTQAVFDNYNSVLYFCKKDYKLKEIGPDGFPLAGRVINVNSGKESYFNYYPYVDGKPSDVPVKLALGDSRIFEDASWTVSYDPKSQFWISFHDWHPDLVIPTKDSFITTRANQFYKHGANCGDYCNFYGVQYPFEIEFPVSTGQTVTTVKSIEYVLECYRREKRFCTDQFHVLDYNFDRLVIHNSEQISGYLNLNVFPKNNIALSLLYPQLNVNNNSFDILFSKEENKYRVNQFWDITKDRGEFPNGSGYPPQGQLIPGTTTLLGNYPENMLWITEANGYKKAINPTAVDYNKSLLQRKKFRHMVNFMYLSKTNSRDTNMILKLFNSKNQYSLR